MGVGRWEMGDGIFEEVGFWEMDLRNFLGDGGWEIEFGYWEMDYKYVLFDDCGKSKANK